MDDLDCALALLGCPVPPLCSLLMPPIHALTMDRMMTTVMPMGR
jgi:hypothetical protein